MIIIPSIPFRRRAKRANAATLGPATLTLVSAFIDEDWPSVVMVFNQPVSVTHVNPPAFTVDDAPMGYSYVGTDGQLRDAMTVEVLLEVTDVFHGPTSRLNAATNNGITAVSDGKPWSGATELALPYP